VNIDFSADPTFSTYVVLLMVSGIAMIVMASPTVKHSTMGVRALNALFGVGFLGYGFYLAFLFQGGGYFMFLKAFILPVLMIFRTIRSARASRAQEVRAGSPAPAPGQPAPALPAASQSAQPAAQWGAPDSYGEPAARP
jgi:predicted lipid-binding transport protein (Tim44 family)